MNGVRAMLRCPGCETTVDPLGWTGWRCPHAPAHVPAHATESDGAIDHVLRWISDPPGPSTPAAIDERIDEGSENPFVRYRTRLWSYELAQRMGWSDAQFVALVERLDEGLAFRRTPLVHVESIGWVKDETGNVSGSHKGRHLFGLALHIELRGIDKAVPLVIASCGNAALAAATIASALGRPLHAYVPTWADAAVLERLDALGAMAVSCPRREGERGDPCVTRARQAVAEGAVPFGCQGSDNALTIDGARTIGWELTEQAARAGVALDRVFVQVGGGALASALAQSIEIPLHAVQAEGCAPLARAHGAMRRRAIPVTQASRHRTELMWPWTDPHSQAHGILDDETYDWVAILEAIERRSGEVIVASEASIDAAWRRARAAGFDVDATATAGLAGLLEMSDRRQIGEGEQVAVLFTGRAR